MFTTQNDAILFQRYKILTCVIFSWKTDGRFWLKKFIEISFDYTRIHEKFGQKQQNLFLVKENWFNYVDQQYDGYTNSGVRM